jgi:TonB-linked SusC/RagA family outer membrane protein
VNTIAKRFDLLDANEFIAISNEKFATANTAPQAFPGPNNENTDWQDVIFQNGTTTNHSLSFSGGSEDVAYYISAGYMKQEGAVRRNAVDRYSAMAKVDYSGVSWLDAGIKLQLTRQVNNGLNTGANGLSGNIPSALKAFPNVPVYDANHPTGYNITADGRSLGRGNNLLDIASNYTNAQYTVDKNIFEADNYRILSNGYLQANIVKGLSLRTQGGVDLVDNNDFQSWDPFHGDGGGSTRGYVYRGAYRALTWNWHTYLNYRNTFAENHTVDITAGYEAQKSTYRNFFGDGSTFSDPLFVKYDLISNTYLVQSSGGGYSLNGFDSYFARLNYDFKGKYLLGLSLRNDAISSLPKENRQGTFPSVSVGWVMSEESFMDIAAISMLKLRGSYAETGNTFIPDFSYVGSYNAALYGGQTGIVFSRVGNGTLKWESSTKVDVGLEFGLFNNRITGEIDYYQSTVEDMILAAPTAPSAGIPTNTISKNIGAMVNKGIEITLSTENLQGRALSWNTDINFSTNNNEVTRLVDGSDIVALPTIQRVGEPLNAIYTFEYAGVNRANGNPLYVRGDGTLIQGNPDNNTYYLYNPEDPGDVSQATTALSNQDLKVFKPTTPTWYGGLTNTFRYKGFDFELFLTFAGGHQIFNATRQSNLQMEFTNNSKEILNRWTPENPDTDVPRLKYANSSFLNVNSTRFVEDGDYLRVQNISLGYTIPKSVLEFSKGTISNIRIYAQVRNAAIFTKYKGSDPEAGIGIDNNTNPLLRTYNFGLSIGL